MIVALAPKRLIALWRSVTAGEAPRGAILRPATTSHITLTKDSGTQSAAMFIGTTNSPWPSARGRVSRALSQRDRITRDEGGPFEAGRASNRAEPTFAESFEHNDTSETRQIGNNGVSVSRFRVMRTTDTFARIYPKG